MKNIFKYSLRIFLILFVTSLVFSCRSNDDVPEDIHEHEEIEKLVVKVTNKSDASVQTINYIGGAADGHLHLHQGDTYTVELDFQAKHDDHYHSMNSEIIEEKDEHFITFAFAGSTILVKRAADDVVRTDGKRVGLKTEWTVSALGEGSVNIKLNHGASSVEENYPSADNQQGKTTGGESDVNALIQVH